MDQEKFNLTWHTYTDHLREMLFNMSNMNEMTDVTLVCEDKQQIKAHKVVLSACSPVFKTIICDNLTSIPLIYLRGIESCEMQSILEFIYLGHATVYQSRMTEFMSVAKTLEIKDISKDIEDEKIEQSNNLMDNQKVDDMNILQAFDEKQQYKELKLKSSYHNVAKNDLLYSCDQCEKQYPAQRNLWRHKKSAHEGVKYPCNKCSYKATQKVHLQYHKCQDIVI